MLGNSYTSNISSLPKSSNRIHQQNKFDPVGAAIYGRASHYLDSIPEQPESNSSYSHSNHSMTQSFPNSIGEYGMGRLLGRGAFGSVYEVTEIRRRTPLNDFKYAIKIVKLDTRHIFTY